MFTRSIGVAGAALATVLMVLAMAAAPAQSAPELGFAAPQPSRTAPATAAPLPLTLSQPMAEPDGSATVEQLGVTCFLDGTTPFPEGSVISFSAWISCDGQVAGIGMQLAIYRNGVLDAVNPPIQGPGPFLSDTAFTFCSTGNFVGVVFFAVQFLSGFPPVISGAAATDEFTIVC